MGTTYRKIAELTSDTYFKLKASDDANYSLRYFAELAAQEVAEMAYMSAIENSNNGEGSYSNDQFISVFKNLPMVVDTDGEKYTSLPSTPAGLPNNAEISEVRIVGSKCMSCIPMTSRGSFAQSLIGIPKGMVLYKIENGKIVFVSNNPLLEGTVNIRMVGAVSGTELLTSALNIPKNYEGRIITNILKKLLPLKNQPIDYVNDSISNPS